MADNSKKISELPTAANAASTDRILILREPSGNASVRTITVSAFSANILISNSAPATSTSNGIAGAIRYSAGYIYICTSNNTWLRSPLNTW